MSRLASNLPMHGKNQHYFFEEEGVQAIVNTFDKDDEETRLNNKDSLWYALKRGTWGIEGINLNGPGCKIPLHVLMTTTWKGALTNAT